jgi:hypothetical protein
VCGDEVVEVFDEAIDLGCLLSHAGLPSFGPHITGVSDTPMGFPTIRVTMAC